MTRDAKQIGWLAGWYDAERFVRGTHADRAKVRRRLQRGDQWSTLRREYRQSLCQRLEDFAHAIEQGRIARTVRPSKCYYLINGHGAD